MANLNDWIELEKLSKLKKSPIGYAPFVDICLEKDKKEALKYLPKVSEELKVKYYLKAGYFILFLLLKIRIVKLFCRCLEEAARIAFEQKDVQNLLYVQSKCTSLSSLSEKINTFIAQLDNRK